MDQVKQVFSTLPSDAIDWKGFKKKAIQSRLDPTKKTLAEIFEKYFEGFTHCVESAKVNYEGFKSYPGYKYEPVRLVVADQPWFMVEKNRSLEEYDSLIDEPFWLRGAV